MDTIQNACDADHNFIQEKTGQIPDGAKLTLLEASIMAGLIKYEYTLLAWTENFRPIADLEFDSAVEARTIAKAIKRKGFHGLIQQIVRKKAEDGFMAYHATLSKDWTFWSSR